MFGPLGFPELLFISLLALLIFGPKKLPELGRTLGKAMAEFRKATTDLKRTINAELIEQELREADPRKMVRDSLREAKESLEKVVRDDDRRAAAKAAPAVEEDPTEPPPEPEEQDRPRNRTDRTDRTDSTDPTERPGSPSDPTDRSNPTDPSNSSPASDSPTDPPPPKHQGLGPSGAVPRGAALEEE